MIKLKKFTSSFISPFQDKNDACVWANPGVDAYIVRNLNKI